MGLGRFKYCFEVGHSTYQATRLVMSTQLLQLSNQFCGYQTYREEFQYYDEREQPGDVLEALGEETSNLFQDAFQNSSPRKKSKLSVKLTRRLSCLVQTSGGRSAAVSPVPTVESWDIVAEVHRPSRLYSVDSHQKPTFSRRQILASLEEENGPSLSPSSTSTTNVLLTMLYMYLILWIFTLK